MATTDRDSRAGSNKDEGAGKCLSSGGKRIWGRREGLMGQWLEAVP